MSVPLESRFTGTLVGQCLGDALGFIVEGQSPHVCRSYVHNALRGNKVMGLRRGPFRFGQYSDDSQLARELLVSCLECGEFNPADYARRIDTLFQENRVIGHGQATERAARRLAAGATWEKSGEPAPAAGNGSAMRAAPIGLLFFDDLNAMVKAAHDQGRITHQDPRCSAGAAAIAGAVALALKRDIVVIKPFVEHLEQIVTPLDAAFGACLSELQHWAFLPPEEVIGPIAHACMVESAAVDPGEGISPYVVSSVLWSLYSFLSSPGDYWRTVTTAIIVGGDVDTTAAMAGAISGALNGFDALPSRLLPSLNDQGNWGVEDLVALARKVCAMKLGTDQQAEQ